MDLAALWTRLRISCCDGLLHLDSWLLDRITDSAACHRCRVLCDGSSRCHRTATTVPPDAPPPRILDRRRTSVAGHLCCTQSPNLFTQSTERMVAPRSSEHRIPDPVLLDHMGLGLAL